MEKRFPPFVTMTTMGTLIFALTAVAQPVPSSCDAPQEVLDNYRDDADRLMLQYAFETENEWMDSVALDAGLTSRFLDGIIAIYNAPGIEEVDTIFTMLDIHAFPRTDMRRIIVGAQPSQPWVQSLINGNIPTGNSSIDELLVPYGVTLFTAWYPPWGSEVVLRLDAEFNVNTVRLAQLFQGLPAVLSSSAEYFIGYGDEITGEPVGEAIRLVFSHGWQCNPWYCAYRRYWEFLVEDCAVEFIGSSGSMLYPVTGLSTDMDLPNGPAMLVHPNPVTDILHVRHPEGLTGRAQWVLNDLAGRQIDQGFVESRSWSLPMTDLSSGTYLLQVVDAQGQRAERIVKN